MDATLRLPSGEAFGLGVCRFGQRLDGGCVEFQATESRTFSGVGSTTRVRSKVEVDGRRSWGLAKPRPLSPNRNDDIATTGTLYAHTARHLTGTSSKVPHPSLGARCSSKRDLTVPDL
nr:hypothetical protein CFP56_30112 [Quercus suber]